MNGMSKTWNVLRYLVAGVLAVHFIWFFLFSKESVGYFSETNNGATQTSVGTTPANLLLSIFGIALFCVLMSAEVRAGDFTIPPLWQRFAAFVLDFYFSVFVLGNMTAIVVLLLEAQRTGVFEWHIQRNYSVISDALGFPVVLTSMAAMILYFVLPLARRTQTVGWFLLRIATVSAGGSALRLPLSTAFWRTYKEFMGLCSPLRTIRETDSQGRTWYDRETGFMVVRY
jgi:hypothetical protein